MRIWGSKRGFSCNYEKRGSICTFFGTFFGLLVAFGVWRLNASVIPAESQEQGSSKEGTKEKPADTQNTLTIAKPIEYSVFPNPEVEISGITKAGSWVVVYNNSNDTIDQAGSDGSFNLKLKLDSGVNQVFVDSFDENGKKSEEKIILVYSSQYFESQDKSNSDENTTEQKVEHRIENSQNPVTAYVGTITDIAERTLHIKNGGDEIKQASTNDKTSYASESTSKNISFSDLAIGDFIIAMGTKNANGVLDTGRVVVSKAPGNPQRIVHWGEVVEIAGNTLTLSQEEGQADLKFPKTWKGPDKKRIRKWS